MCGKKVNINLASHPLRNRRFFLSLVSGIVGVFLIVAVLSAFYYAKNRGREGSAREALTRMRGMVQTVQKERDDWSAQVSELSQTNKDKIGSINSIILKKSFSWVDFFSRIEEALPEPSYISWMASLQVGEGPFEVRFKVVSQTLQDLLEFIQRLNSLGFKDISVKNETPLEGRIVSEISVSHERTL